MKNFISNGKTVLLTVPAGGVASGQMVLFGTKPVVCVVAGVENDVIAVNTSGVYLLPKAAPLVMAQGDIVYFDEADAELNKTAVGNTHVGYVVKAALSADTEVEVYVQNSVTIAI